jgi:hypothetical protein
MRSPSRYRTHARGARLGRPAPRARRPHRPAVLSAALAGLAALALGGCDVGQATLPDRSVDPSASPIIETRPEVCFAIDGLEQELIELRAVRLRPGNRGLLDREFGELDAAWGEVRRLAPEGMDEQLESARRAVVDLWLAVEDFVTAFDPERAVDHVRDEATAFEKAIGRLRERTDCPPPHLESRAPVDASDAPSDASPAAGSSPDPTPDRIYLSGTPAPGSPGPDATRPPRRR